MTIRALIENSLAVLAVVVLGTGCSTCNFKRKDVGTLEVSSRPLSLSETLTDDEMKSSQGWAEYAKGMLLRESDPEKAHEHFRQAFLLMPSSMKALNEFIMPLLVSKQAERALKELEPIVSEHLSIVPPNIIYAKILAEQKRIPEAIEHLQKCCDAMEYSDRESALALISYQVMERRLEDAEGVFKKLTQDKGASNSSVLVAQQAIFWNTIREMLRENEAVEAEKRVVFPKKYTQKNCEKKATAFVERLPDCSFADLNEFSLAGDVIASFNRWDLMWKMLEKLSGSDMAQTTPYISMRLDALKHLDKIEEYREYALSFMNQENLNPRFADRLAMVFIELKDYKTAIQLIQRRLVHMPNNAELILWLARIYVADGQLDQALKIYEALPRRNPHDEYMVSIIWRQKGRNDLAYNALVAAEKKADGDKDFLSIDFYYSFAAVCEKLGKIDEAVLYSKKAYELDKDNPSTCNFYGYMLADYDRELPFAKELISKAVKEEPENAAYLDSMAWVCYKLGEYKEALEFIMKALECGGIDEDSDGVITKHAADICRKNGLEELARHYDSLALIKGE